MMMISSYSTFALLEGFLVLLPVVAGLTIRLPHPSASPPPLQQCPARCTCNKSITDCSGLGYHQIPDGLPSHTTALNMSHNRISTIDLGRLLQLSNLRELYLQENQVTFIPHDLWVKLPQLKILDLSSNFIACSCPLEQLEKHLQNLKSSVHLINKNKTDCTRYLNESNNKELTPLETCILKLRWKRKPSCASIECKNGGVCRANPRPMCECTPPFYGMYCELTRDDSKKPGDSNLSIQVLSITYTTIEISWSVAMDFSYARFQVNVQPETPSISSVYPEPVVTTMRSFIIDDLMPSTSYRICVQEIYPDRGLFSCLSETTQSFDTTQISSFAETGSLPDNWIDSKAHENRPPYPQKPDLPHPKSNKENEGEEMHYALISLAALFGICLLLTVMIGFVYYKRVHGNIQEEPGTTEPENMSTTSDRGADRGTGRGADRGHIVLVSSGNELNTDIGHVNATFDPDSNNLSQVQWTETDRKRERSPSKRSVRFDLSDEQQSSQHAMHAVIEDNVDTENTTADVTTTDA